MFYGGVLELGETFSNVFDGVMINETAVEELMESGETSLAFVMRGYACMAVGEMDGAEAWKMTVGDYYD